MVLGRVRDVWSLLLACFGCFVGEELDRYSACRRGADLDVEKDSRAVDGGGHGLWLIDLAMQVSTYNLGGWTLLSCKKYWRFSWAPGQLHVNPIAVITSKRAAPLYQHLKVLNTFTHIHHDLSYFEV